MWCVRAVAQVLSIQIRAVGFSLLSERSKTWPPPPPLPLPLPPPLPLPLPPPPPPPPRTTPPPAPARLLSTDHHGTLRDIAFCAIWTLTHASTIFPSTIFPMIKITRLPTLNLRMCCNYPHRPPPKCNATNERRSGTTCACACVCVCVCGGWGGVTRRSYAAGWERGAAPTYVNARHPPSGGCPSGTLPPSIGHCLNGFSGCVPVEHPLIHMCGGGLLTLFCNQLPTAATTDRCDYRYYCHCRPLPLSTTATTTTDRCR